MCLNITWLLYKVFKTLSAISSHLVKMPDVLLGSYNSIRVVQMMAENQSKSYCNGLKEKEF